MIKGLAHACFYVKDIEKTLDYYCNKLGLKLAFDFINKQGERYGFMLHAGGIAFIEFFKGRYASSSKPSFQHICFEIDNIQEFIKKIAKKGLSVSHIEMGQDRALNAWTVDPDGNNIEFHQYTKDSKQTAHMR